MEITWSLRGACLSDLVEIQRPHRTFCAFHSAQRSVAHQRKAESRRTCQGQEWRCMRRSSRALAHSQDRKRTCKRRIFMRWGSVRYSATGPSRRAGRPDRGARADEHQGHAGRSERRFNAYGL